MSFLRGTKNRGVRLPTQLHRGFYCSGGASKCTRTVSVFIFGSQQMRFGLGEEIVHQHFLVLQHLPRVFFHQHVLHLPISPPVFSQHVDAVLQRVQFLQYVLFRRAFRLRLYVTRLDDVHLRFGHSVVVRFHFHVVYVLSLNAVYGVEPGRRIYT